MTNVANCEPFCLGYSLVYYMEWYVDGHKMECWCYREHPDGFENDATTFFYTLCDTKPISENTGQNIATAYSYPKT